MHRVAAVILARLDESSSIAPALRWNEHSSFGTTAHESAGPESVGCALRID